MENEEEKEKIRKLRLDVFTMFCMLGMTLILAMLTANIMQCMNQVKEKEIEKIQTELNYYELKIEKLEKGE